MKRYTQYAFLLATIGIVLYSCKKDEEYPELMLGTSTAPQISLELIPDSVHETYAYITLSSDMDGHMHYAVLAQGDTAPSASELLQGKTDPPSITIAALADVSDTIKLRDLTSGGSYEVYAVASNAIEGKPGEVVGPLAVNCPDYTAPYVVSMTPTTGSTNVPATIREIVLTFNEAVTLADAAKVRVVDVFDETDLPQMGAISVSGSEVTIAITDSIPYKTDVGIQLEEGAFTDAVGIQSSPVYKDGEYHVLRFSIGDLVDISLFTGAYRCTMHDVYYADNDLEYDVIMKGSSDASGYYLQIVNFMNINTVLSTLTIYPDENSIAFDRQSTGISYGADIVYIHSVDSYGLATPGFYPGTFLSDGSLIKVWAEMETVTHGYGFGYYEVTFTKYDATTSKAVMNRMKYVTK